MSRIKKIIQLDDDIVQCSTNATFVISIATVSAPQYLHILRGYRLIWIFSHKEMFIQYLAEQGHNVVKSERKPRKTIQYKDLGQSTPKTGGRPMKMILILRGRMEQLRPYPE